MKSWIEFSFLLKVPYHSVGKDSLVKKEDGFYVVKRIDSITLLDESVGEPATVKINARGIKRE